MGQATLSKPLSKPADGSALALRGVFPGWAAMALIAAVALAGCGNWSDEDAQFLSAIPKKEDLILSGLPAATSAASKAAPDLGQRQDALLGLSSIYGIVSAGASGVNAFVARLTAGLDFVRSLPPSLREEGRRGWGPYADAAHPGLEMQIAVLRESAAYRYEMQWRQRGGTEFVTVIVGHFRGERAKGGSGDLTLDFDKARWVGTASAAEENRTIALHYDLTRQTPNEMVVTKNSGARESWEYIVDPDGGGDVQFRVDTNLYALTSALETMLIHARWRADRTGRAAIVLSGGDLPTGGLFHYGECWAANQSTQYWSKDFGCPLLQASCSEGDESACSVPALE